MKFLKRVHAKNILKWGKTNEKAIVLSGDLTTSCEIDEFRNAYPERFLSFGLMEQNMMSFAAGLAREGLIPMVHTFSVFMYRRALDQIEMSIAYPNLPVKFFGFLPGVTTPGGASHQALNDIAVMRSLPNMSVIETGDATDVESVLELSKNINGPVYIRMIRGEIPRLFSKNDPTKFSKARKLSHGSDIALFTSGICTEESLLVTNLLREKGITIQHLHITTLKPFDDWLIDEAVTKVKYGIITMENHTSVGGLGTCVAELIAKSGLPRKLIKIAINDTYLHGASKNYLMKEYKINAEALVCAVEELVNEKLDISEMDVSQSSKYDSFSENQPEAL